MFLSRHTELYSGGAGQISSLAGANLNSTLASFGAFALEQTALDILFDTATSLICRVLNLELCLILELTPEGKTLIVQHGCGMDRNLIGKAVVSTEINSQAGYTLRARKLVAFDDLREESRFIPSRFLLEHDVVSGMATALQGAIRPFGVIGAYTSSRHVFDETETGFFQSIANILSSAIQRQAQAEALLELEERLRVVLETSKMGTWVWDRKSGLVKRNAGWNAILGTEPVDSTQSLDDFIQRIHPEDRDKVREAFSSAWNSRRLSANYRVVRPDGSVRYIQDRGKVLTGEPGSMAGAVLDVTDTKRNEEALAWAAAVVEFSEDAIVGTSLDGIIQTWNKAAERLFKCPHDQAIGGHLRDVFSTECARHVERMLQTLSKGETVQPYEIEEPTKTGETVTATVTLSAVRDPEGKLVGASAIIHDIGRLKSAERAIEQESALRESEARFRELAETIPQVIWTMKPDGTVDWANQRWTELTGLSLEQVCSADGITAGVHPADVQRLLDARAQAVRTQQPIEVEFRFRTRTGEYLWHLCRATPVTARQNGNVTRWVCAATNIDDEKRISQALQAGTHELEAKVIERTRELNEHVLFLERLLYGIAHHLRAPLRAIDGFTSILQNDYAPELDSEFTAHTRQIIESAMRMDRLITGVLELGRLSHQQLPCEKIELRAEIDQILSRLAVQIQGKHADISVEGTVPPVWSNSEALQNILAHLLSNAIRFVPPERHPVIRIRAEQRGHMVRLWIVDNGVGIPVEYQDKIFDLFEQLGEPIEGGTGIGLAIVRKAAERVGGFVGVESEYGKGASFWVDLPAQPHDRESRYDELFGFLEETDALVLTDTLGRLVWVNKRFTEICGYTFSEVYRKSPGSFLQGPNSDPEIVHKLREAIRSRQPATALLENYRKSGESYLIQIALAPVRKGSQLRGFAAVEREVVGPENPETVAELQSELDQVLDVLTRASGPI